MAFSLENLRPAPGSRPKSKRVGRGSSSGKGKTSSRGHKGQGRGTGKVRMFFEGGQTPLFRRIPIKGFKNRNAKEYVIINLSTLEEVFEEGNVITPEILLEKKIIKNLKDGVKILGKGELTKALVVKAHAFSRTAKEKIEAVGGKAEVI
ncbi:MULTISPECIES: 50S ribosomal protein L15 [Kosmotoga]|uniref:Large ribosomal subunit protein uL15 n=1 Tax=Kosmotoga olearia (strain ATCC BAA-1733 / DSM 21960 / TBF 19.5.1) TaxID=521045 RepID=RL15_KOSOT|nr:MULTISPECIES: 50S ribosomal protein L15 [Kosmotoga]C5CGI3.1 RecName: Full=Large ribosomal subunit protein uL15; AltName: Full=50S ribosomal protein L15 [Kosmotoga olearia TBF 19.5.1]ACR80564.1 ribosomal protein L15 [Kosmotoga olearia TBF 19.5.1]MDI3523305.1 large subunit ribosomal protein [Kosmotoga sp.]MDK2952765.1 large subunit ribosomal protein [Kosmotoga sp.]OAA19432.1 50S ribosomal protein L15 [Kosmotoga sp. DU53]